MTIYSAGTADSWFLRQVHFLDDFPEEEMALLSRKGDRGTVSLRSRGNRVIR